MHNQMNSSTKYMFLSVGHCRQKHVKCKLKEPKNLGSRLIHLSMKKKGVAINIDRTTESHGEKRVLSFPVEPNHSKVDLTGTFFHITLELIYCNICCSCKLQQLDLR